MVTSSVEVPRKIASLRRHRPIHHHIAWLEGKDVWFLTGSDYHAETMDDLTQSAQGSDTRCVE